MAIALTGIGVTYLIAVVLLWRQRHQSVLLRQSMYATVYTGLSLVAAGVAYFQAAAGLPFLVPYKAHVILVLCFAPLFRIALELQGRPRAARIAEVGQYALWSAIFVLTMATNLIEAGVESFDPFEDRVGPLEQQTRALISVMVIWAGVELARGYRKTEGLERRQLSYVVLGLALYCLGAAGTALIALALGKSAMDHATVSLFSVPWIALTLYSASRYRLFEARYVMSQVVAGVVVVGGATGLGWGVFALLSPHVETSTAVVATVGLVAVPMLAASRLRGTVEGLMDRLAGRGVAERDDELGVFEEDLGVDELGRRIVELVERRLDVMAVALYLEVGGGLALAEAAGAIEEAPRVLPARGAAMTALGREPLFIGDEQRLKGEASMARDVEAELAPLTIDVVASLHDEAGVTGALVIGARRNRDSFTRGELEWIDALAARASLALDKARLRQHLERAHGDLEALLRTAAHDLRTPLRAIDNLAQFAAQDLEDDPSAVPEHLAAIRTRSHRMDRLLDGLDSFLRVGEVADDEHALLADVISDAAEGLTGGFSLEVELADGCEVLAPRALEEVLTELFANSMQHHDRGEGTVRVRATMQADRVEVAVEDDGPGIDAAYHDRIFGLFETLARRDVRDADGVGLAKCRKLVEVHGGAITVSSDGRGATFHFSWPVALDG